MKDLTFMTTSSRHETEQQIVTPHGLLSDIEKPQTLIEMFEAAATAYPDRIALTDMNTSMTYSDLNARANRLAHYLRRVGVVPETIVPVCMERSSLMIVALLGILKAGGAYLPLDPAYPVERMRTILEDAPPIALVSEDQFLGKVSSLAKRVISIDGDWPAIISQSTGNPVLQSTPDHLAYVIYTSGSTGKPKGVLVTHANVSRLLTATDPWFHFGPSDVWTFFHSYAFDFSVWEIWGCLLTGGRLVIVPWATTRSPQDFYALLSEQQVTVLNQTPAAFYQLIAVEEAGHSKDLALRTVIFGGEALNFKALIPWFERHGDHPQLVNMYGITETTVHVTYRIVTAHDAAHGSYSLIGVPISDMQVYLLDEELKPVTGNEIGEIFVGGAGVARGYLNRPELDAERFVSDPSRPGQRLYKSGDLGRILPDGELEYLGRRDSQVKINGFRIELGEIEAALAQHPQVQQNCVIMHTDSDGTRRLAAYFVPRGESVLAVGDVSEFLRTKLPAHMVPTLYLQIEKLPLTPNGKIDRAALPSPFIKATPAKAPSASGSDVEEQIAQVWRQILKRENIGFTDNFFDVGGSSVLLVSVHTQLQSLLQRKIAITDLFAHTTIRSLATKLKQAESSTSTGAQTQIQAQAQKQREALARMKAARRTNS
jgi:amino acid adenylation domain-containing protein